MGLPEIGLSALFDIAQFSRGLKIYEQGLDSVIGKTQKSSGLLGTILGGVGRTAALGLGVAVAGAGAAIAGMGGFIASSIGPASDLSETMSKVGVVFGTSAKQVLDFGNTAATGLGMSKNEALTAAGIYGNLFRAMGMAEGTSAEMSTSLVSLAGDLASFNNMAPEEVLDKLRAGLSGETEPLRTLGVNLNAAQVEAKALSMGLGKTTVDLTKVKKAQLNAEKAQKAYNFAIANWPPESAYAREMTIKQEEAQKALNDALAGGKSELTAAEKAQATYALIMDQTTLAQGDFERTSSGLANQQRIMAAQWKDLQTTVGTALLPSINQLMGAFTSFLSSPEVQAGIQQFAQWLAVNLPIAIQTASTYWTTVLWPALQSVWSWMQSSLFPTLQAIWVWLAVNVPPAVQALAGFWQTVLLPAIQAVGNWITTSLIPTLQTIGNWLSINIPLAINTFLTFWNGVLLPALTAVWLWIQTFLVPLFQAFGQLFSVVLTLAVQAFTQFWQAVFQPALETTGGFLSGVLIPAFGEFWSWLAEKLQPVLDTVSTFLGYHMVNALRNLEGMIKSVIRWVQNLAKALASLVIPKALSPGSPTPFEIGLHGVGEAVKQVTAALAPMQFNLAGAGGGGAYNAPTPAAQNNSYITNNFDLGGQTIQNGWNEAQLRSFIITTVREAIAA